MSDLKAMRTFVEVVRQGSFAAAAQTLGQSTSSTSRQVLNLEDWLGVQLLHRSPRMIRLTEAGNRFLERCASIVTSSDEMQQEAHALHDQPRGTLHVASSAHPMRRRLAPIIPTFLEKYPQIQLNFHLQNEQTDLIAENIDVALRIGQLVDSSLVARKCGDVSLHLTASPGFLEKHGTPPSLNALPTYACLSDMAPSHGRRWPVGRRVAVDGPVTANDGEVILEMTRLGLGISLLPDFFVENDIAAGRLLELFPEEIDLKFGMYLIYPSTRKVTPAVRTFVDFVAQNLKIPGAPLERNSPS